MSTRRVAATVCLLAGFAASAAGCGSGSGATGGASKPTVNVTNIANAAPLTETVIATRPELQKLIPAKFVALQVKGNPAALAGMKSGAYDIVTEVGGPPVVTALVSGINLKVIWAEPRSTVAGWAGPSSRWSRRRRAW